METRLQQLRRARSDRLRAQAEPMIALAQRLGWACPGCGCDVDGYSLECDRCYDRARSRAFRGRRPELRDAALAYLAERKLHYTEENRRRVGERTRLEPWKGHAARPLGAQGHYGAL